MFVCRTNADKYAIKCDKPREKQPQTTPSNFDSNWALYIAQADKLVAKFCVFHDFQLSTVVVDERFGLNFVKG